MWKRFDGFMQTWYEDHRPISTIILNACGYIIGAVLFVLFVSFFQ